MSWDRVKAAVESMVRTLTARYDYAGAYEATVKSQNPTDLTVGVVFDDPRFDPQDGVPLRYGAPGVTAKVSPGARVTVMFANQDPSKPRVCFWEPSNLVQLLLDGGSLAVARATDPVSSSADFITWLGLVGTATGAGVAPTSIGTITSGAPKVVG